MYASLAMARASVGVIAICAFAVNEADKSNVIAQAANFSFESAIRMIGPLQVQVVASGDPAARKAKSYSGSG